ncbi:MAG: hypothetical protein EA402_02905 [Planctomycetota bacterium]|nr:MAG: hypothetical protein EA402_02905 [Planctomycetota bacterium]
MIIASGAETNAAYHASGAWGSTRVSDFLKSPLVAWLRHSGQLPQETTAAMTVGSALHARFDGSYPAEFAKGPEVSSRRTKAWTEAETAATGKTLLLPSEVAMIDAMEQAVRANPYAQCLLDGAEHEVGIRRKSPYGDYRVQCRVDVWRKSALAADLKTTGDLDGWAKSVMAYGYHRQAAFYRWLIHEETGDWLPFSFIVVEKSAPHRCRVIDLDEVYLVRGWEEVEQALHGIGHAYANNDWSDPGYQFLNAPGWMQPQHAVA